MSVPYCTLHQRLFDQKRRAWIHWSQDYVSMVQHLCDILDSAHIPCADYQVTEAACDTCVEIARQALREQLDTCD